MRPFQLQKGRSSRSSDADIPKVSPCPPESKPPVSNTAQPSGNQYSGGDPFTTAGPSRSPENIPNSCKPNGNNITSSASVCAPVNNDKFHRRPSISQLTAAPKSLHHPHLSSDPNRHDLVPKGLSIPRNTSAFDPLPRASERLPQQSCRNGTYAKRSSQSSAPAYPHLGLQSSHRSHDYGISHDAPLESSLNRRIGSKSSISYQNSAKRLGPKPISKAASPFNAKKPCTTAIAHPYETSILRGGLSRSQTPDSLDMRPNKVSPKKSCSEKQQDMLVTVIKKPTSAPHSKGSSSKPLPKRRGSLSGKAPEHTGNHSKQLGENKPLRIPKVPGNVSFLPPEEASDGKNESSKVTEVVDVDASPQRDSSSPRNSFTRISFGARSRLKHDAPTRPRSSALECEEIKPQYARETVIPGAQRQSSRLRTKNSTSIRSEREENVQRESNSSFEKDVVTVISPASKTPRKASDPNSSARRPLRIASRSEDARPLSPTPSDARKPPIHPSTVSKEGDDPRRTRCLSRCSTGGELLNGKRIAQSSGSSQLKRRRSEGTGSVNAVGSIIPRARPKVSYKVSRDWEDVGCNSALVLNVFKKLLKEQPTLIVLSFFGVGDSDFRNIQDFKLPDDIDIIRELELNNNRLTRLTSHNCKLLAELKVFSLNLSCNQLSDINGGIELCSNLKLLNLSRNKLETLPEQLCELKFLEVLNLSHNSLQKLPQGLGRLKKLEILSVASNTLEFLPDDVAEQGSVLSSLDISHNSLFSHFPVCSENWSKLEDLELEDTIIHGLLTSKDRTLPAAKLMKELAGKSKEMLESRKSTRCTRPKRHTTVV